MQHFSDRKKASIMSSFSAIYDALQVRSDAIYDAANSRTAAIFNVSKFYFQFRKSISLKKFH